MEQVHMSRTETLTPKRRRWDLSDAAILAGLGLVVGGLALLTIFGRPTG